MKDLKRYKTSIDCFTIRETNVDDAELILEFIKKIAVYEKLEDKVTATVDTLKEWIFEKGTAEVLIGEENGKPVAYCVFCKNFSTFVGKAGLYIEDIFVDENKRGNGYGKVFFKVLAQIAEERGYGRMEWVCLDWNKPSIDFYLSMDAEPLDEWTIYRLSEWQFKTKTA